MHTPPQGWSGLHWASFAARLESFLHAHLQQGTVSGQGRSCLIADCGSVLTRPLPGAFPVAGQQSLRRGPRITGDARAAWEDEGHL